ncbi:MAG TPA: hypothetical protein VLV76_00095 [Candidatus Acidoferrum sp.]|nr:hypothetical protein [Candidatus Acidoferrum sp.]
MRVHGVLALVSAIGILSACSSEPRQVGATAPTVTYSYRNAAELRDAKDKADDWCSDRYGGSARPAERWPSTNGEVTFVCVAD